MGKIKDAVIKKLGGHTSKEWDRAMGVRFQMPKMVTELNLETIAAEMHISRGQCEFLGSGTVERIIKSEAKRRIADELEPFVEFTVLDSRSPRFDKVVIAKLRVLRQEEGGVIRHGPERY